jgi:predicted nucleic acid-binding protein
MTLIVDANVAIRWIVQEDSLDARALALRDGDERLEAPDLIISEVLNVAWKKWRLHQATRQEIEFGFAGMLSLIDVIHPSMLLYQRAMTLALALDHPAYDCFYLACAEEADGVLVTADRRLCDIATRGGLGERVRHLSDHSP